MKKPIPFGKYLLLERVNVGGMAEVFLAKAFGVEGFERLLAIKRILPTMVEDEEFITMFLDEARISVQLNHANVVQIYELGKHDDSYYIAMEYVSGKDLRHLLERFRKRKEVMPTPMAVFIASKICEGLDYAHRKKDARGMELHIVHRDVSPQNILISYDAEVKIIDFGIAKAANRAQKTQAGILKGKFGYMSPEQVRGLPIDHRSDIFAVGVILYEMLTGERLFVGESDFSTLEKVRNADVLPPRQYNANIPVGLEKVVLKALARDAEDRYQWCSDLQEDLMRYLLADDTVYSAKQLSNFMKESFADDLTREAERLERFAQVERPDQVEVSGITASASQKPRPVPAPEPEPPPPPARPRPSSQAVPAANHRPSSQSVPAAGAARPAAPGPRRSKPLALPPASADPGATLTDGFQSPVADSGEEPEEPRADKTEVYKPGTHAKPQTPTGRRPTAAATRALGQDEDEVTATPVAPPEASAAIEGAETVIGVKAPVIPPPKRNGHAAPARNGAGLHAPVDEGDEGENLDEDDHPTIPPGQAEAYGGETVMHAKPVPMVNRPARGAAPAPRQAPAAPQRSKLPLILAVSGVALLLVIAAAAVVMRPGTGKFLVKVKPEEAKVRIDGVPVENGVPSPDLQPGEHVIEAEAEGYEPFKRPVALAAGVEQPVQIELSKAAKGAGEPSAQAGDGAGSGQAASGDGAQAPPPGDGQAAAAQAGQPGDGQQAAGAATGDQAAGAAAAAATPAGAGEGAATPTPPPVEPVATAGKTKEPEIAVPAAPKPVPTLTVESTPAGADVTVAGKKVGKTPLTLKDVDPTKAKTAKFSLKGYKPAEQPINWDGDKVVGAVSAVLEKVEEPPQVAATPKTGGDTAKPKVDKPKVDKPPKVEQPKGSGKLVAMSKPPAEVAVDGKPTGRRTPIPPAQPLELSAGDHVITFTTADGRKATRRISVPVNETVKLTGVEDFQ